MKKILKFLQDNPGLFFTTSEVAEATEISKKKTRKELVRLFKYGEVFKETSKEHRGIYLWRFK